MRRNLGRWTSVLSAVPLLLTLAGYAENSGPAFEILANFRLHLACLAGLLVVILGLIRLWRSTGLAVLTMLVATAGLGPVFAPPERQSNQIQGNGHSLTLLYANLWDRNIQPQALAAMLRTADADILITSETPRTVAEGPGGLRTSYPYHLVNPGDDDALRTAIWSKFPLRDGTLYLNNNVAPTGASAIADLDGTTTVALIGAHFSRPFERRHRVQIESLGPIAQRLAANNPSQPLIVTGDFNASPWTRAVARAAEVTGTQILGGYRVTWKGDYETPLGRLPEPWGHQIDQMLLSSSIAVATVETLQLPGSDHLGLFVGLRIPTR